MSYYEVQKEAPRLKPYYCVLQGAQEQALRCHRLVVSGGAGIWCHRLVMSVQQEQGLGVIASLWQQEQGLGVIASLCRQEGPKEVTRHIQQEQGGGTPTEGPGRQEEVHLLRVPGGGVHNEAMTPHPCSGST